MNRKLILIFIIILGFLLRFWHLGINPPSLDWDEASLGYNAFSILKTGKDEYGKLLPLSIQSFGDYKPPLYTYLSIGPVSIFGLNEFSTRFTSALIGSLTIIVVYLLVSGIFSTGAQKIPLLTALFFSISPWHIQFSRIAFEANSSLFFFIFAVYLFLRGLRNNKYIIFSFLLFTLSMYTYHSPRLIIPLFLLGIFFVFKKDLLSKIKWFLAGFSLLAILVFPIIKDLQSASIARLGSVSVLNVQESLNISIKELEFDQQKSDMLGMYMHNRRIEYFKEIISGYLDHFNLDFLFLTGDSPGRHHASGMGMLYIWDAFFIPIGILYLLIHKNKYISILMIWFVVAPLAAALTTGTPHAVRAIFFLPLYQIFSAVGVLISLIYIRRNTGKNLYLAAAIFICLLLLLNFFYYMHMYWIHTPLEYSQWWQYGYKQVVKEVKTIENRYDKVIITFKYDQPYIYFLYYNQIDPSWYQQNWDQSEIKRSERIFGKYVFRKIDWSKDSNLQNVLLVGSPDEIPDTAKGIIKEIHFLDGSVAFRLVAL